MEFRKLRADEIDVRIQSITKTGSALLLLYKDARCDQNILDETVGPMNWQRKHTRDNANCIVGIWDDAKGQWVEKEDTGTESNTEKEKGLASDSFKRACFNWGIGRELYTAPTMFFPAELMNDKYDRFRVTEIEYEGNVIADITVLNEKTGESKTYSNRKVPPIKAKPAAKPKKATQKQVKEVSDLIVEYAGLCESAEITDITELLKRKFNFKDFKDLDENQITQLTNVVRGWVDKKKGA